MPLADSFVETFFSLLESRHLSELHLSAMGLTSSCAPHIISHLSSPRCALRIFKCNGNSLGFRAVRSIIRAIERNNFTLLMVEMYSNQLPQPPGNSDNTSEDENDEGAEDEGEREAGLDAWKESDKLLRRLLSRNAHLRRETETEAVQLLRYSRTLLLRSARPPIRNRSNKPQRFTALPTELQLYIMTFLAPVLSSAQRIRIYNYAASPATLPRLLPNLLSGKAGDRMGASGSFVCHRDQERRAWLAEVRCEVYDPF